MSRIEKLIESQLFAIDKLSKIAETTRSKSKKNLLCKHIEQLRLVHTSLVTYNSKKENEK